MQGRTRAVILPRRLATGTCRGDLLMESMAGVQSHLQQEVKDTSQAMGCS